MIPSQLGFVFILFIFLIIDTYLFNRVIYIDIFYVIYFSILTECHFKNKCSNLFEFFLCSNIEKR